MKANKINKSPKQGYLGLIKSNGLSSIFNYSLQTRI